MDDRFAALRPLVGALAKSRHVMVLTGSGISAESGVPTFREAQTGLWERFDPHELATPAAFERDPELVWRWYRWRAAAAAVEDCDLFLSVGTSALVWPAAGFAGEVRQRGVAIAEINPEPTPLSDECDYRLCGKAGTVLPELLDSLAMHFPDS